MASCFGNFVVLLDVVGGKASTGELEPEPLRFGDGLLLTELGRDPAVVAVEVAVAVNTAAAVAATSIGAVVGVVDAAVFVVATVVDLVFDAAVVVVAVTADAEVEEGVEDAPPPLGEGEEEEFMEGELLLL